MTRRRWAVIAVALASVSAAVFFWWMRPAVPPEIPVAGLDPPVADLLRESRAAVVANPRSAETWGTLGRALLANQVYTDKALGCFQEAERLEPASPHWRYLSAGLLLSEGKIELGMAKLRGALSLCTPPFESDADLEATCRLLLAETLAAQGDTEAALAQFQQVVMNRPDEARALLGLGLLLGAERGDWQACRTNLERCLSSPQARKKAALQLATACEHVGDSKAAAHYADLAARLPKDLDWTDPFFVGDTDLVKQKRERFRIVEQLEAAGRFTQAAKILNVMVAEYPDDDLVHMSLGRILAQLGDLERAEQHLRNAMRMAPARIQSYYLLSLTLYRKAEAAAAIGAPGQAAEFAEQAAWAARTVLERRADYGYAHMALGLALKMLNRKPEALAEFREAVHCNPEFAENHLHLGTALAEAGQLVEARSALEQALLLAPQGDPRPRAALAQFFPKKPAPE